MSRNVNKDKGKPAGKGVNKSKGNSAKRDSPLKPGSKKARPEVVQDTASDKPKLKFDKDGKEIGVRPKAGFGLGLHKKGNPADGIRLNKYIANSGICSRREADTYISTGLVTVNGKIINEMGHKVQKTDDVRFDGRRLNPEPNTYVLLNKPKGFATTDSDSKGRTVMDLVANATTAKIKPFGRLGRNASGLLLFTNDDEFVHKFSKKGMTRLFHIELDKSLKAEHLKKIEAGFTVDGEDISVEEISYVNGAPKNEIGMKIKHTGNKVIRTIFDHLDYDVIKVDCVTIGPLTKKDLTRGHWRHLTERELNMFKML